MISLDQVYLLEQKVESAVEKIKQLQAENDALRSKCAELTNALSAKSELLETFENDKGLIENGIQKALDHLNSIDYSVIKKDDQDAEIPSTIQDEATSEEQDESTESEEEEESSTEINPIELENKMEEEFQTSPLKIEIPNVFGAPMDYPISLDDTPKAKEEESDDSEESSSQIIDENASFDSMTPIADENDENILNSFPFDNNFASAFDDSDEEDEESEDENKKPGIGYW